MRAHEERGDDKHWCLAAAGEVVGCACVNRAGREKLVGVGDVGPRREEKRLMGKARGGSLRVRSAVCYREGVG